MFKVSLGSFGALLILADHVSRKRLIVEQSGRKFWPSVHFQFSLTFVHVVFLKRIIVEQNGAKFGPTGEYLVDIGYFKLLSVQFQFGVIQCISSFEDLVSTFG